MRFIPTQLKGAFIIEPELKQDERGFFARTFCTKEFHDHKIGFEIVQCNLSFSKRKGTLRGMHYQSAPFLEAKLVMCTRGAIYDVILDIRPESATYKKWISVELAADNYRMLYIPEGFAHGFQTLEDDTMVYYLMSDFYHQQSSCGISAEDPVLNIQWPVSRKIRSEKDQKLPDFSDHEVLGL
jgi:dTDP-4-dehydrorhamnose 3,5-epimerase